MQVFKVFLKIVKGNISTLIVYFFVALGVVFITSQTGQEYKEQIFKQEKIDMAIIDYDNSVVSEALVDYMKGLHNVKPIQNNQESMIESLVNWEVSYILEIPKGFGEQFAKNQEDVFQMIHYRSPDMISDAFVTMQVNQYLKNLSCYLEAGYDEQTAVLQAKEVMNHNTQVRFYTTDTGKQTGLDAMYHYFIFLPFGFITMLFTGLGSILIIFRTQKIGRRNACAPISKISLNIQLTLSALWLSLVLFALFMIVPIVQYRAFIFSVEGFWYVFNALSFLFFAAGIAFLCSIFINPTDGKAYALDFTGNVLSLGLCFLGGIFVPREFFNETMQKVTKITPTHWYVRCAETILQYTGTHEQRQEIFEYMGIQMLFVVAIFAVALAFARIKRVE